MATTCALLVLLVSALDGPVMKMLTSRIAASQGGGMLMEPLPTEGAGRVWMVAVTLLYILLTLHFVSDRIRRERLGWMGTRQHMGKFLDGVRSMEWEPRGKLGRAEEELVRTRSLERAVVSPSPSFGRADLHATLVDTIHHLLTIRPFLPQTLFTLGYLEASVSQPPLAPIPSGTGSAASWTPRGSVYHPTPRSASVNQENSDAAMIAQANSQGSFTIDPRLEPVAAVVRYHQKKEELIQKRAERRAEKQARKQANQQAAAAGHPPVHPHPHSDHSSATTQGNGQPNSGVVPLAIGQGSDPAQQNAGLRWHLPSIGVRPTQVTLLQLSMENFWANLPPSAHQRVAPEVLKQRVDRVVSVLCRSTVKNGGSLLTANSHTFTCAFLNTTQRLSAVQAAIRTLDVLEMESQEESGGSLNNFRAAICSGVQLVGCTGGEEHRSILILGDLHRQLHHLLSLAETINSRVLITDNVYESVHLHFAAWPVDIVHWDPPTAWCGSATSELAMLPSLSEAPGDALPPHMPPSPHNRRGSTRHHSSVSRSSSVASSSPIGRRRTTTFSNSDALPGRRFVYEIMGGRTEKDLNKEWLFEVPVQSGEEGGDEDGLFRGAMQSFLAGDMSECNRLIDLAREKLNEVIPEPKIERQDGKARRAAKRQRSQAAALNAEMFTDPIQIDKNETKVRKEGHMRRLQELAQSLPQGTPPVHHRYASPWSGVYAIPTTGTLSFSPPPQLGPLPRPFCALSGGTPMPGSSSALSLPPF